MLRLSSLPSLHIFLTISLLWSSLVVPALSQRPLSKQFQWKFTNDLGILVQSWDITLNDTFGIPPYYMLSFEIDSTPQTQFIGTNNRTLEWTVRHPPGSKLLLGVVDSTQSSGGIPPRLFNVVAGSSTDCVVTSSPDSDFTVTANITETLNTCEPWGLTIKGGIQPYNISLPAVDSPFTTNLTVLPGFDHFTYINRASPGTQLIAGKSDVSCPGLDSSSGVASERARKSQGGSNTALIAGVTVPIVVLLLGGIGFAFWFLRRKKQKKQEEEKLGGEAMPFDPHGSEGQSDYHPINSSTITPFDASTVSTTRHYPNPTPSSKHMEAMGMHPVGQTSTAGGLSYATPSGNSAVSPSNESSDTSSNAPGRRPTRPSFAAFPTCSTRSMNGKAAEAAADAEAAGAMSPDSEYANAADEIVIQHRDGAVYIGS
ncbi:hypothetical protein BKA70DRAFT_1518243 [Coprinopsis sp. MPI-PUGE-AT-0042]|nr:hypothetical protein BKA70DRAFT_1518243 [Coprinopsis sp. MPI-PUGE-AT-0042]